MANTYYGKVKKDIELTDLQKDTLDKLTDEKNPLTPIEISKERGVAIQAVRRLMNKLKLKGVLKELRKVRLEDKQIKKRPIKDNEGNTRHYVDISDELKKGELSDAEVYEKHRKAEFGFSFDNSFALEMEFVTDSSKNYKDEQIKNLVENYKKLEVKNKFLEERCKELWEKNESLSFKLFLKSDLYLNKKFGGKRSGL